MVHQIFNQQHPFHVHAHKGLVEVVAPTAEPVTLPEMRLHLKIDSDVTDDNDLISGLIVAARKHAEMFTRRAFVTQTWDLFLDDFPGSFNSVHSVITHTTLASDMITVPKPPLASVTTITYVDTDGVTQTLVENTDFVIDTNSEPGRIIPEFNKFWPSTRSVMNAVKVRFVAGYGDETTVPDDIKAAIKVMVGGWYNVREELLVDRTPKISGIAKTLLWGKRIVTIK